MRYYQNLHTHSTFSDGKNSPEEMILAAIGRGFGSIGFSEHSPTKTFVSNADKLDAYQAEVRALAERYKDSIDVFCGLEYDVTSVCSYSGYDYLIGSAHRVQRDGLSFLVDGSVEEVEKGIEQGFGGDGLAFALAYFRAISCLPSVAPIDIIGHFDLASKNIERANFFDPSAPEYQKAGMEAIDALAGKIPFFEVNTGAIARGYRTTPYPAPEFVREFKRRGFGVVITSDCHDARLLDRGYEDAVALLESCGYTEQYVLRKGGFEAVPLRVV
jgi:histidinol-phosphatase (PHP family)